MSNLQDIQDEILDHFKIESKILPIYQDEVQNHSKDN